MTTTRPPIPTRSRVRPILNVAVSTALVATSVLLSPRALIGLVVVAVVCSAVEALWPLHGGRRRRREWLTDLTHAVGNRYPVLAGILVLLTVLSPVADRLVPDGLVAALHRHPWWAQAALLFVLTDLGSYLGHRALHRSRLLWRLHRVHHSSERLDWLATSRVHPLDLAFNVTAASLPAFALGYTAEQPWLLTFQFLYPFLLHTNARLPVPLVGRVLVYPAFHHWHHASAAEAHDANFGAILSVWDRLFGTAHEPGGYPDAYGIGDGSLATADYLDHLRAGPST